MEGSSALLEVDQNWGIAVDWALPNLVAYFDQRSNTIENMAGQLRAIPERQRGEVLGVVESNVRRLTAELPRDMLLGAAVSWADDLYKAGCSLGTWDDAVAQYLTATAGTFFDMLSTKGFVVHFAIDATFDDLTRPVQLFPDWYAAAGFIYTSPALFAADKNLAALAPGHEQDAARYMCETLVGECQQAVRHYVLLDVDYQPETFTSTNATAGKSGVIHVFRNEAPTPGSKIQVVLPTRALRRKKSTSSESTPGGV